MVVRLQRNWRSLELVVAVSLLVVRAYGFPKNQAVSRVGHGEWVVAVDCCVGGDDGVLVYCLVESM